MKTFLQLSYSIRKCNLMFAKHDIKLINYFISAVAFVSQKFVSRADEFRTTS